VSVAVMYSQLHLQEMSSGVSNITSWPNQNTGHSRMRQTNRNLAVVFSNELIEINSAKMNW